MLNKQDGTRLERLRKDTLSSLSNALGDRPQEIIYLDTPRHRNLGDTLIWDGALSYFAELGHRVIHHSDIGRHDDGFLRKLPSDALIVLHGGGNLGDLYGEHDAFRRHIVKSFPHRRIVAMPQSIHYSSRASESEAYRDYLVGKNLTFLLREHQSIGIMQKRMPELQTAFCHDVALGSRVSLLSRGESSTQRGTVVVARDDAEKHANDLDSSHYADWQFGRLDDLRWHLALIPGIVGRATARLIPSVAHRLSRTANSYLMNENMRAASLQYSGASKVVTNRLHAHVLAALLGIPHYVADNSYGKISSIFNEYTGQFTTAHMVPSLADGLQAAQASSVREAQ